MSILILAGIELGKAFPTGKADLNGPIWQGNTGSQKVSLSINVDWGDDVIPEILSILSQRKALVTFYVTGSWAEKHPELLKQMAAAGHSIQTHGYKHIHFNQLSRTEAENQIQKGAQVITDIIGRKCKYFASPYGEFEDSIVHAAEAGGFRLIMWSVDTIDWKLPEPERIIARVLSKLHNDAIVLMHPTEPTVQALPKLLDEIIAQGYTLVTIEDILNANESESRETAA